MRKKMSVRESETRPARVMMVYRMRLLKKKHVCWMTEKASKDPDEMDARLSSDCRLLIAVSFRSCRWRFSRRMSA